MVDKKGYIKTLEAVLAIVLLLIFVYTIIPSRTPLRQEVPPIVESAQKHIKTAIEQDEYIRMLVVNVDPNSPDLRKMIGDITTQYLPLGYAYDFEICEVTSCVINTPDDKTIYVSDILISAQDEKANPRIVRIWVWEK